MCQACTLLCFQKYAHVNKFKHPSQLGVFNFKSITTICSKIVEFPEHHTYLDSYANFRKYGKRKITDQSISAYWLEPFVFKKLN